MYTEPASLNNLNSGHPRWKGRSTENTLLADEHNHIRYGQQQKRTGRRNDQRCPVPSHQPGPRRAPAAATTARRSGAMQANAQAMWRVSA